MFTMILISSAAIFVGIAGCIIIWGLDAMRADEIERPRPAPATTRALPDAGPEPRSIERG